MGNRQRPVLCEPRCRRPCCLPSSAPPNGPAEMTSAGDAGCHLAGTQYYRDPTAPVQNCWKTAHFLSPKESHRNSDVLPRQSGRQTGSLCIEGRTLTKLPQSVQTLWRETLHPQASRGTAGVCGRVRARMGQLSVAQTLCCAANKPSLLILPPRKSDVQSHGRHSRWSLAPLKDHRVEHAINSLDCS